MQLLIMMPAIFFDEVSSIAYKDHSLILLYRYISLEKEKH